MTTTNKTLLTRGEYNEFATILQSEVLLKDSLSNKPKFVVYVELMDDTTRYIIEFPAQ